MISPKAVFLGVLAVIIVGLLFSAASPQFEMFFARWLVDEGDSLGTILDKMYWPATIYIGLGIFAAFSFGSYVATRFSRSEYALDSTVVAIGLLVMVWVTRLYSGGQNLFGFVLLTLVAILAAVVGTKLARRTMIADIS